MLTELNVLLNEQQAFDCLKYSGYGKQNGRRSGVQKGILIALLVYFVLEFVFTEPRRAFPLVMAGICLLVLASIYMVPYWTMKKQAKRAVTGKPFRVRVCKEAVRIGVGEKEWSIPVSQETKFCEKNGLLILKRADGVTTALPVDSFPDEAALASVRELFAEKMSAL